MGDKTTYLFAVPSWASGVAHLLDFGDTMTEYNGSATPQQADLIATALDWMTVGDDLRGAMTLFEQEQARSA